MDETIETETVPEDVPAQQLPTPTYPFTHTGEDGELTEYTFDEVLSCDENSGAKKEWINAHILRFKEQLVATDYIALKLAEGAATQDEYAEQIASRQALRDTINTYQDAINALDEEVEQ